MAEPKGLLVVPVGFRSDGSIHALELDASDRLKVLVDSITGNVTVVQSDPANLFVGDHVYDGATWRKKKGNSSGVENVIVDSVTGVVTVDGASPSLLRPISKSDVYINTALAAGTYFDSAVTVPAGETWRFTGMAIAYVGAVTGLSIMHALHNGTYTMVIHSITPVVASRYYDITANILVQPGWKIGVYLAGATLNDTLIATYFAERVF
jgi:hypothetical protein